MHLSFRAVLLLSSVGLCVPIGAQKLASVPVSTATQENSQRNREDDEMLARTARLYYSTKAAGLNGFDCAVHPDWRTLIQSSVKNAVVPDHDPNVLMLERVTMTLHARLNGLSTLDWKQPADTAESKNRATAALLEQMHRGTEQTIQGFMQFWKPFVDGSIVPARSTGIALVHTDGGVTIRIKQGSANVTEVYSKDMVLQRVSLITDASAVELSPSYDSTDKGLLVSRFVARIRKNGASAEKAQEMHVEIYYQQVDGFPLPSRLNVEVVGTGVFNFQMDGCRANPAN
jgi:hypothetical protein